jgi:hypothetical protein
LEPRLHLGFAFQMAEFQMAEFQMAVYQKAEFQGFASPRRPRD